MNNYVNYIMNNVTCRFASVADRNFNDNRISLNIPNTDLYINFVITKERNTVSILKNTLLEAFDISPEELLRNSLFNMREKEVPYITDFESVIGNMSGLTGPRNIIVSNVDMNYGAILILNKNVQDIVYEKLGVFYILPSSVHEVICLSKNVIEKEYLLQTVRDVNQDWFMTDTDRLADDVYEIRDGILRSAFLNDIQ